jgi:hypothetical protein
MSFIKGIMIRFRKGERLICINSEGTGEFGDLVVGAEYEVIEGNDISGSLCNVIKVANEYGVEDTYNVSRFMLRPILFEKQPPAPSMPKIPGPIAKSKIIGMCLKMEINYEFIEIGQNYFVVRFVSNIFKGFKMKDRHAILDDYMQQHFKATLEQYVVLYEAFTPMEMAVAEVVL